jgi:hypothetical protein
MSPNDASEDLILQLGASEKLSHRSVFLAACVDASVRPIGSKTKPAALRAAISIAGNDDATEMTD